MTRDPFDPLDGPVDATVDLHGMTGSEARVRVATVLADYRRRRPGCLVHIITGKGRHSPAGPVVRPVVRAVLKAAPKTQVRAFGRDIDDGGFLVRLGGGWDSARP